jgi:hypothetical protein
LENLPNGSYLWFSAGILSERSWYQGRAIAGTFWPQFRAKEFKIVMHWSVIRERFLKEYFDVEYLPDLPFYGTELVLIGPFRGVAGDLLAISMAKDFSSINKVDAYGTPLDDYDTLPLMQEFNKGEQCAAAIVGMDTFPVQYDALKSVNPDVKILHIAADLNRIAREAPQYWNAGLLDGFVIGLKMAGNYELLSGVQGLAYTMLFANVLIGVILVGGMIGGTALYFVRRQGTRGGG